jgi:hypothetical protein
MPLILIVLLFSGCAHKPPPRVVENPGLRAWCHGDNVGRAECQNALH